MSNDIFKTLNVDSTADKDRMNNGFLSLELSFQR